MAVTAQLCERIVSTDYDSLGTPAIEAARRLVLDGISIAIAGTEEEAIHILAAHHKEQGGAEQATAIGNGFRLNTVAAAALNGAAMHVLDFEPMWSPANHALSTTLAGVLALAEARGASGRDMNQSGCSATQRESMPIWLGTMSLARRMPRDQARSRRLR